MKYVLLSEVNIPCLYFTAKSMEAKGRDAVCPWKKKFSFPIKRKDGVAVKGRGDRKVIKQSSQVGISPNFKVYCAVREEVLPNY